MNGDTGDTLPQPTPSDGPSDKRPDPQRGPRGHEAPHRGLGLSNLLLPGPAVLLYSFGDRLHNCCEQLDLFIFAPPQFLLPGARSHQLGQITCTVSGLQLRE